MGVPAAAIRDQADLEAALAGSDSEAVAVLVTAPVAPWLRDAVDRVRRTGRSLQVHLAADDRAGEGRAGQEIGMVVAVLSVGVHPDEVVGVAPERVRRVAEVLDRWDRSADRRSPSGVDAQAEVTR